MANKTKQNKRLEKISPSLPSAGACALRSLYIKGQQLFTTEEPFGPDFLEIKQWEP